MPTWMCCVAQVCSKAAKGSPIREQQCEVKEAERDAPRPGDARPTSQDDQCPIVAVCLQDRGVVYGLLGAQSDDALVLLERSSQIADLQMDGTQRGGVGQLEGGGATPYGLALVPVFTTTSPCLLRPCVHSSSALALRIRGRPATTSRT